MPQSDTAPVVLSPDVQALIDEGARRSTTAAALREMIAQVELLRQAIVPLVESSARWDSARATALEALADAARKPIGYGPMSVQINTLAALALVALLSLAGLSWLGVAALDAATEARRLYAGECVPPAPLTAAPLE